MSQITVEAVANDSPVFAEDALPYWATIIDAPSMILAKSQIPAIADIPAGSPVRITLGLPLWLPVADIANLAGAEFWIPALAGLKDLQITDVFAVDNYTIEIDGIAGGLDPNILAGAMAGALAGFALGTSFPVIGNIIGTVSGLVIGATAGWLAGYIRLKIEAEIAPYQTQQVLAQTAQQLAQKGFSAAEIETILKGTQPAGEAPKKTDWTQIAMWGIVGVVGVIALSKFTR